MQVSREKREADECEREKKKEQLEGQTKKACQQNLVIESTKFIVHFIRRLRFIRTSYA
jgi:hypothetical protein